MILAYWGCGYEVEKRANIQIAFKTRRRRRPDQKNALIEHISVSRVIQGRTRNPGVLYMGRVKNDIDKTKGMRLKKPQYRKKRKKHKASILQQKDGTCYLCMLQGDYRIHPVVHEHHIYDGPNRAISEAEGFKVYLCLSHHTCGPEAVHNNRDNMRALQREAQKAYERTRTRAEFMDLIGRNYLD